MLKYSSLIKMQKLKNLENKQNYNLSFVEKLLDSEIIFNEILNACNNTWSFGTGSYLFEGQVYEYSLDMFEKQFLLYEKVKTAKDVLEIGTYMGHSLLIMLLANPSLNITCVDIDSSFTRPGVEVLKKYFPNATINFIHSDSLSAITKLDKKFDFFHIDGSHENDYIKKEFEVCKTLCKELDMSIVFDDVACCRELETYITNNFTILEHITPNCIYPNTFFRIKL